MDEAALIKKLKAQEQTKAVTKPKARREPTYFIVEPWLVVATRLALIVLAAGAFGSVVRDIITTSGEMLRMLMEAMG